MYFVLSNHFAYYNLMAAAIALKAANVSTPVGIIWLAGRMKPCRPLFLNSNPKE